MKLLAFVMVAWNLFWQHHSSCKRFERKKVKVKVTQLFPTLWDPMNNTVYRILQARILQWVAFPFSRGSSQSRDRTQVSHTAGRFFTSWATREALRGYLEKLKVAVSLDCAERKEHILRGATEIYEHRGSQVWVCVLGRSGVHEHDADVGADGVKCHMLSFKH